MILVRRCVTVARRDAGAEPTGRYLRRVTELSTEFMSITELARSKATVAIRLNIEVDRVVGQQCEAHGYFRSAALSLWQRICYYPLTESNITIRS